MRLSDIEKIYYVYTLIDPITEQIRYVGITYRPKRRYRDHLQQSKKKITHRDKWINSILQQNQFPIMEIVDECSQNEIGDKERFWIGLIKDFGFNLTNHTDGGEGLFNPTPETRQKMSNSQKGKHRVIEYSAEYRQRRSEMALKLNRDKAFCEAISKAKKNIPQSKEHRRALAIQKMKGKKVQCLETEEIFDTLIDISEKYHIKTSTLCSHLKGKTKTCKGFKFKYVK